MHSFLCFSKIGFLHDIDLYLGSLSLEICDFDSKQLSLPVAISGCRAAPMGANPLGHTFKPLTLYDISIYTIYFSHPREHEATVVIPPKSNAKEPWPVDYCLYKERHLVECFFQKIKWFRRVATRYDKLDKSFLAFVYMAAIMIWLL